MNALVVYDSTYGNTEKIARAIADGLTSQHTTRMIRAADAQATVADGVDLLVVGGPTQRRHAGPGLRRFLDSLPRRSLSNISAATFDTSYRMSRALSGSAAVDAGRSLKRAGADILTEPESFFMERDRPPEGGKRRHELEHLEPGETERARAWAAQLAHERVTVASS